MSHFNFWVDGPIVGIYLLISMAAGVFVKRYVGKVEHFLVAGREMNVFLGIASLAATEFGIVTCMYSAEAGFKYGFAGSTPGLCQAVAMFLIGVTGFCIKPLRDSGVITIPELLERRFGPRVRWAAGVVIVLGGLLNMGIFLRMGGDFLVKVCGLQTETISLEAMMTILLVMVAVYTILGGMLSVLVTDFLQFVVMSIGLIAVTGLILYKVGWENLADTVMNTNGMNLVNASAPPDLMDSSGVPVRQLPPASPLGEAAFNPFSSPELGWPFVIFNILLNGGATLTWQTTIARVLSAKDTATGRKVYTRTAFFFVCQWLLPGIWGIAALFYFTKGGGVAPEGMQAMDAMPLFLGQFVPIGLMGLLIAAMLAADMSTESAYMLTWGSVIYNDLLAPFHRHRWSDKTGLMVNRFIVACIGLFLLFYGLWYKIQGNVWDYLTVTGAIYLSSMSTLLISACYLKWTNNWGAIGAIVMGAVFPTAFLVMQKLESTSDFANKTVGPYYSGIAAFAFAAAAMVIGSLLKNIVRPNSAVPAGSEFEQ